MKTQSLLHLVAVMILAACEVATSKDEIKAFIPGVYLRYAQHEYGKEWDTLHIRLQNESANEYRLTRRWRYERVLDGNLVEPEYKIMTTTAVYDKSARLLKGSQGGETYSFDREQKCLFAGSTRYEKLN